MGSRATSVVSRSTQPERIQFQADDRVRDIGCGDALPRVGVSEPQSQVRYTLGSGFDPNNTRRSSGETP